MLNFFLDLRTVSYYSRMMIGYIIHVHSYEQDTERSRFRQCLFIPIQPSFHPPKADLHRLVCAWLSVLEAQLQMKIHQTYLLVFHLMHTQVPST